MEQTCHRRDYRGVQLYNKFSRELSSLIIKEEIFWKQRAKKFCLKEGDLNTKNFHASATCRSKVNQVLKLRRDDGNIVEDQPHVKSVAVSYFQELLL